MIQSKMHAFVLMSAVLMVSVPTAAQSPGVFQRSVDGGREDGAVTFVGSGQGPELGLIAVEPFDAAKAVTGVPYTADSVTEITQVLADGNRIDRKTSASIARDSRGRIRREHQAMVLSPLMTEEQRPLVTISDPTIGMHVTLDHERRVAHRVKTPAGGALLRGEFNVPVPPGSGGGRRVRPGSLLGPNLRIERLGERTIEGVRAEGTRTTLTIKAEAIGNRLPIEVVSERWYSLELQAVILSRRSDPRFGDTVYRLVNIVRAEPAPELFEVPTNYRIEEQSLSPGQGISPVPR